MSVRPDENPVLNEYFRLKAFKIGTQNDNFLRNFIRQDKNLFPFLIY